MTQITGKGLRVRRLALAVAAALASEGAAALGLGNIELYSSLNEPLNAEIRLLGEQPGELNDAQVTLAPEEAFARVGIERSLPLLNLSFTVTHRADGTPVIKITSPQPIREPFLDFLVELHWKAGILIREYTLLLDPPSVTGEHPAPVALPETTQAAPTPTPTPAPLTTAPTGGEPPRSIPWDSLRAGSGYGPVRRDETLWDIAQRVRPDNTVSVYQTMLALLRNNPEAFEHGNLNDLKAGYILRVPDRSVIAALSQDEAFREASQQYELWRRQHASTSAQAGMAAVPALATGVENGTSAPAAGSGGNARLRLVVPDGAAGKGGANEAEKMQNDLALALESADAAKHESDELRARVAALEERVNALQRLLNLKEGSLSQLQNQGKPPIPATTTGKSPTVALPSLSPRGPLPRSIASEPGGTSAASGPLSNPVVVGGVIGAIVLVGALGWLMVRRRAEETRQNFEPLPPVLPPLSEDEESRPAAGPDTADAVSAKGEEEPSPLPALAAHASDAVSDSTPEAASPPALTSSPEGEIDPLVEADVYLAYRRYQQAEDLIQSALTRTPTRLELKAKLLEIYSAAKNGEAFQHMAQQLFSDLGYDSSHPLWLQILPLGKELCPHNELFGGAAPAAKGQSLFDIFNESYSAPPVQDKVQAESSPEEEKFDLNIDFKALEQPAVETLGQPPTETGSEVPMAASPAPAVPKPEPGTWDISQDLPGFGNLDFGVEDGDLLAGTDVVGTKLDLARAYIDMGDHPSARDILTEVTHEGNEQQQAEARALLSQVEVSEQS